MKRTSFVSLALAAIVALTFSATAAHATENWYNGFSPEERVTKLKVFKKMLAKGEIPPASAPCMLCNDPDAPVEYHSEDYGLPYLWEPPAVYTLCRNCHRYYLHTRFTRPTTWQAYVAHIRRGGYASDLKDPAVKAEIRKYRLALERGEKAELKELRPYKGEVGKEWFANLRMDKESLTDPAARPRGPEAKAESATSTAVAPNTK